MRRDATAKKEPFITSFFPFSIQLSSKSRSITLSCMYYGYRGWMIVSDPDLVQYNKNILVSLGRVFFGGGRVQELQTCTKCGR